MDQHEVEELLGDANLAALARCVWGANSSLRRHRLALPEEDSRLSNRGRPSWLHDQIWGRIVEEFSDSDDVELPDQLSGGRENVTMREVHWFGGRLVMRVKKHHPGTLAVACYPTRRATSFLNQGLPGTAQQLALDVDEPDGFVPANVILGYVLDPVRQQMTQALISYRRGNEVLWTIDLAEPREQSLGGPTPIAPAGDGPPRPSVRPSEPSADANADGTRE